MASFVIHQICGEEFLKRIEKDSNIKVSKKDKNNFLMGNLIVDSVIKKDEAQIEKIKTHFRANDDLDLCIQIPYPEKFVLKYGHLLNDFSVLGYLFHLYTDKIFFNDLFLATFTSLDKDKNATKYAQDTKYMYIKKNKKIVSVQDFWSSNSTQSIYQDYTVMNKLLLDYFMTSFNVKELLEAANTFVNPGITEVSYQNIASIILKTEKFILESMRFKEAKLNIFDEEMVIRFINEVIDKFLLDYGYLLSKDNGRKRIICNS